MNPRDQELIKQVKEQVKNKAWGLIFGEVKKPEPTISKPTKPLPPLNEGKDQKPPVFGGWSKWDYKDKQGLPVLTPKDLENAGKPCKDGNCRPR